MHLKIPSGEKRYRMKNKLKLYFGKQSDEVEEKILEEEQSTLAEVDDILETETEAVEEDIFKTEEEEPKAGKLERNTISLIFVDEKHVELPEELIEKAKVEKVEKNKTNKTTVVDEEDFLEKWKIPDVETAFSAIDQTIEEQFQKAREQARKEAGLDAETKQQQRMRIESEFRERRRKRLEEQRKKNDKRQPSPPIIEENTAVAIEEITEIEQPLIETEAVVVNQIEPESTSYTELYEIENDGEIVGEPANSFTSSYLDKKVDKIFEGLRFCSHKLGKALEKLQGLSANGIDKVDGLIAIIEKKAEKRIISVKRTIFAIEHYFERRKKRIAFLASISIIGILIVTFAVGNFTAYEYMYNGKLLGVVKNQEEVYKTIDVIGDKLTYEHNAEVKIDKEKDITFNRILAVGQDIDDKEDILNRLTYMKDITAKGYAIIINGKQVAVLSNEESAKRILDEVENSFMPSGESEDVTVGFVENVLIESVETKLGSIESEEKVAGKLFAATANNGNGEINPLLNIQTEEIVTYNEAIPYGIAYEDTMTKYKGETTVKSKGTEGQKQIIAKVVKTNGKEVEREILKESTVSEPITQIVLRGSKEPPKLVGTGTFVYPIRGTITSRFGYRWGAFHQALDIAAPAGTPIKASDGGTVTYSGWKNSYGYIVEIDHGGNRTTKYAHCSKLLVKEGQKVYQGMQIALVGSTGNSTGPHVHFEVLINGVPKNPLSYL